MTKLKMGRENYYMNRSLVDLLANVQPVVAAATA